MNKKNLGAWSGIVLLLVTMLACNPLDANSRDAGSPGIETQVAQTRLAGGNLPATAPTPEPTVSVSGRLGERVAAHGVAITISHVENSEGTADVKPEQGKTFIIVHLTIENLDASRELEVDEGDFQLRDAGGATLDPFPENITSDQIESFELGPSEKADRSVVFEVPPDLKSLHLLYDFNEQHIDIDFGK